MSEHLSPMGTLENIRGAFESAHPHFIREKLILAQQRSWQAFHEIRARLRAGMTEDDARKLALEVFDGLGIEKHWHKPYIRFGAGTTLTFHEPLQQDYFLKDGDAVYVDLGPIWPDHETGLAFEGDVGDTFAFGQNPEVEACAETARKLFQEARNNWKHNHFTGEQIYQYLRERAPALGYTLKEKVDGHRLGDFPHQKYSRERLAKLKFCPSATLWVLEVQITDPHDRFGAFFEDVL